jgi:hypothetical protein
MFKQSTWNKNVTYRVCCKQWWKREHGVEERATEELHYVASVLQINSSGSEYFLSGAVPVTMYHRIQDSLIGIASTGSGWNIDEFGFDFRNGRRFLFLQRVHPRTRGSSSIISNGKLWALSQTESGQDMKLRTSLQLMSKLKISGL